MRCIESDGKLIELKADTIDMEEQQVVAIEK